VTRVVLVHDYLTQRGGAERVALALARAFPDAPLHTSLYEPDSTFEEFGELDVRTMPIDRVGPLRRHHRLALPLLAPSFSATRVDADVVLCSSSGWAHGVRTDGRKIVYCHAPARWLYQRDHYLAESGRSTRVGLAALAPALRRWDIAAARSADRYLANSERTRQMIAEIYGLDAEVIHPPHGVDVTGARRPVAGLDGGFHLCVSRLLPYKNVDAVIGAFDRRPDRRLVVVGRGPDEARLRAAAGANVRFVPFATDDELRWLYANAQALIGASYEDFGLTPVEAAAFGTPSVVLRFGGYLETVVEGETGVFFDRPDAVDVGTAIDEIDRAGLSRERIRAHATAYDEDAFARAVQRALLGSAA
jgi:glycosyltransferase involved in cell wall biosynthesis